MTRPRINNITCNYFSAAPCPTVMQTPTQGAGWWLETPRVHIHVRRCRPSASCRRLAMLSSTLHCRNYTKPTRGWQLIPHAFLYSETASCIRGLVTRLQLYCSLYGVRRSKIERLEDIAVSRYLLIRNLLVLQIVLFSAAGDVRKSNVLKTLQCREYISL